MHPLYEKADRVSRQVIGAEIEVHRQKGPGLIESIYERCMLRELELRSIPSVTQKLVRIEYKGCRSFASLQQGAALQLHEAAGDSGRIAHEFP